MKKAMVWIVIMLVLGMALNISAQAAGTQSQTVSQAVNGVVQVYAQTQMSNGQVLGATGSAFGVGTIGEETDIFVTNRHVVTEENQDGSLTQAQRVYIMVGENTLTTTQRSVLSGGQLYLRDDLPTVYDINTDRMIPCQVLYVSEDYDFAILQAQEKVPGRVAMELAPRGDDQGVGQQVYALGYPGISDEVTTETGWEDSGNYYAYNGYQYPIYTATHTYNSRVEDVTVTTGIISRYTTMTSERNVQVIQHDATIHSGNSGGPLIDTAGRVVGINTYSATDAESHNYAIYIDYVREALEELNIPYNLRGSKDWKIPVAAGAGAVVLVVIVVVLTKGKKSRKRAAAPQQSGGNFLLWGETGLFAGRQFAVGEVLNLGTDPMKNQLVYPGNLETVSPCHCRVFPVEGKLYLADLGSETGTWLENGQRLTPHQTVPLQPGQRFYLGSREQGFSVMG